MRRHLLSFFALLTVLVVGCGNSENFVFTNQTFNNNNGAGIPAQLAFVQNPAQTVDTDFTVPPIVEVQDVFGNRVPGDTTEITVSLVNPGTAVLNGQTTRNAVDGQAVFTGLSVSQAGTFTLQATAANLQAGASTTFVVERDLALYAIDSLSGVGEPARLVEMNPANGEVIGVFGRVTDGGGTVGSINDLIVRPDGSFFAIGFGPDNDTILVSVNPQATESSTIIGEPFNNNGTDWIYSLTYDPDTQTTWAAANLSGVLHVGTLSLTNGTFTPLPNPTGLAGGGGGAPGLAFDTSTGTLFLTNGTNLHTVNTTTGVATVVGDYTGNLNAPAKALAVNPKTGALSTVTRFGNLGDASFYATLNKTTASATQLGFTVNTTGIAFLSNPQLDQAPLPSPVGYTGESIPVNFTDISGTGTAQTLADDDGVTVNLGFTFNYAGTSQTQVRVISNGYLTFDLGFTPSRISNDMLANPYVPDDSIFMLHTDFDPSIGGTVYTETVGTAPDRRFIAQWQQVEHFSNTGGGVTAQVVLYETSNVIEFHYIDTTFGDPETDNGASAVVGLQSGVLADIWSVFKAVINDNTAIRYTP